MRLWYTSSLEQPFIEHPSSPVRVTPYGSRMAGRILSFDDCFYRFGQDNTSFYGGGLLLFKIEHIDINSYQETLVDSFYASGYNGPHTFDEK